MVNKNMLKTNVKNRNNKNVLVSPVQTQKYSQVKQNKQEMTKSNETILLKEHANRYTWSGRLSDFCILKKIDKKVVDKKLAMTYADFKKIQQEQKTK